MYEHFTIDDNLSISDERRDQIKAQYDPNSIWYKRDIEGQRCVAEGLVYPMFDRDRHVITGDVPPTEGEYYVSSDYGIQNPNVSLLWRKERGTSRWICLKEDCYSGREEKHQLTDKATAANIRLRRLNEKYRAFSKAAGLPEQRERTKVQYPWDITDIKKFAPLKEYQGDIRVVGQLSAKEYVVKLDPPTISGVTQHFSDNLVNRPDRAGLTVEAAQGIINGSRIVLYQPSNSTLKFLADNGYTVLNMQGKIVTAVPEKLRKKYRDYLEGK